MVFTYDLATDRGKVRLLVPDRVDSGHIFEDDEIDAFLAMETGVKTAAALALETIAADEALTLKVIKLLDLSTDGASVARALLQRAAALRQQAVNEEAADEGAAFDVAELVYDPFSRRERLYKEYLRDG